MGANTTDELCGCCDPSCKLWPLSDERIAATERAEAWEAEHGAVIKTWKTMPTWSLQPTATKTRLVMRGVSA